MLLGSHLTLVVSLTVALAAVCEVSFFWNALSFSLSKWLFKELLANPSFFPFFTEYYCHYGDEQNVEAEAQDIWVSAWNPNPPEDYYHSIMIHCPVPLTMEDNQIERVLISEVACDHSHGVILNVTNTEIQESSDDIKDFCVCLKPLDFPNEPRLAARLMEWIESNLQLGAQKIVIYVYSGKKSVHNFLSNFFFVVSVP